MDYSTATKVQTAFQQIGADFSIREIRTMTSLPPENKIYVCVDDNAMMYVAITDEDSNVEVACYNLEALCNDFVDSVFVPSKEGAMTNNLISSIQMALAPHCANLDMNIPLFMTKICSCGIPDAVHVSSANEMAINVARVRYNTVSDQKMNAEISVAVFELNKTTSPSNVNNMMLNSFLKTSYH